MRYHNVRGEIYEVGNDGQLERVLKDAMESGIKVLELKVTSQPSHHGTSSGYSSASSTPNKYTTNTASPYTSSTPVHSSTPGKTQGTPSSVSPSTPGNRTTTHGPAQPGDYHIVTWNIPGDRNSVNSKPKITHAQTHDEFSFWPLPCQHDTEIRAVLRDGSSLVFESIYTFEDVNFGGQKGISTAKVTQTVGLPIKVSPNLVNVEAQKIIIKH